MNYSIFTALIAFSMTLPAHAQNKPASASKIKITCSKDLEYVSKQEGEKDFSAPVSEKGKSSESIRTTWLENGIEYRSSEVQGFDDKGAVNVVGSALSKVTSQQVGNLLTEKIDHSATYRRLDNRTYADGKKTKYTVVSTVSVYEISGNEKILKELYEDNIAKETYSQKMIETKDGDKRIFHMVNKTPHVEKQGKTEFKILKDETTCVHEDLK